MDKNTSTKRRRRHAKANCKRLRPALCIEPARSRKKADEYARRVLEEERFVCDRHVLETLRLWRFHDNKHRTNVFPPGAKSVPSDTLGATKTRSGKVWVTKSTARFPSVFALLAKWMKCHHPASLGMRFPWTSVSMNYAYAAALHRDSHNTAASMTKSFGSFSGGQFIYFPKDDGLLDPRRLPETGAAPMAVDTREHLCLFDGARTHGVRAFQGERYSLVFYTQETFSKAPSASLERLRELGAHLPDDVSTRYYEALLAPPKGYAGGKQTSIKASLFGEKDNPQILTWRATSFDTLGNDFLDLALSFVICPTLMEILCSTCHKLNRSANRASSWRGTLVDCPAYKPLGPRAHQHHKLWALARAIAVSEWQFRSCTFLVYSRYKAWKWRRPKGGGEDCVWHDAGSGHWLASGRNPLPFSNATVLLEFDDDALPNAITFGVADTNCAKELSSMLVGRQWQQPRGSDDAPDLIQLNICCLTLCPNGGAVFEWNGFRSKRLPAAPVSETKLLLRFGVPEGKFQARIGATHLTETFEGWARAIDPQGQYFAFICVKSETVPTIVAKPMLSTKD